MKQLAWIAVGLGIVLGASLASAGCSNGDGGEGTPTAMTTAISSPSGPPVEVPARPSTLLEYPGVIATYLTASPAAAEDCLAALLTAWAMPLPAEQACRRANTDADSDEELVVTVSEATDGAVTYVVSVLDGPSGDFTSAYASASYPLPDEAGFVPVVGVGDLNGDGEGEVAYQARLCVDGACLALAYIVQGNADGYAHLTPTDGVGIAEGSFSLADEDGDGSQELLATGTGAEGTPETGPQRGRTDVWRWDGAAYVLDETRPGASDYLYHHVIDADAMVEAGEYGPAAEAYMAAVDDLALEVWKTDENERNELTAYGLFRAALATLLAGGDTALANGYLDRAQALEGTLHAQLAASFRGGYAAKGEVSAGCAAASEDVRFNEAEYAAFWDYGTANPPFDAAKVCPF